MLPDEALAQYRCGLTLEPDWHEGRWYLGSILYEKERYAEAREAFAALVAAQPTHAGAFGLKGLCEFGLGLPEPALRSLLKARSLSIARTPEVAHVVAYHAGELLTTFVEDFEAELVNSPRHIPARLQIVFELVKRGEAARARRYAEAAVKLDPMLFAAHLAMGQVWFETGDIAKAICLVRAGRAARARPGRRLRRDPHISALSRRRVPRTHCPETANGTPRVTRFWPACTVTRSS